MIHSHGFQQISRVEEAMTQRTDNNRSIDWWFVFICFWCDDKIVTIFRTFFLGKRNFHIHVVTVKNLEKARKSIRSWMWKNKERKKLQSKIIILTKPCHSSDFMLISLEKKILFVPFQINVIFKIQSIYAIKWGPAINCYFILLSRWIRTGLMVFVGGSAIVWRYKMYRLKFS